jgi:DNA-binding phage protein
MEEQQKPNEHWKLLVLLLKEIAEAKGVTHEQIAEASGLQRSNVTRTFSLSYCPNLNTFMTIAEALKVNFFFEDQEDKSDLSKVYEKAIDALRKRVQKLPKN